MGPEPLPRGQYPVSMLFIVIIIQSGCERIIKGMERCTSPFTGQWPMEVPNGETIHRSTKEGKAGQSKPRGMRE
jgi:hypothetical protein